MIPRWMTWLALAMMVAGMVSFPAANAACPRNQVRVLNPETRERTCMPFSKSLEFREETQIRKEEIRKGQLRRAQQLRKQKAAKNKAQLQKRQQLLRLRQLRRQRALRNR